MAADFGRRFEELCKQAEIIDASKKMERSEYSLAGYRIDSSDFINWVVKVRHLLSSVCGPDSQHFAQFVACEAGNMYTTNHEIFLFS